MATITNTVTKVAVEETQKPVTVLIVSDCILALRSVGTTEQYRQTMTSCAERKVGNVSAAWPMLSERALEPMNGSDRILVPVPARAQVIGRRISAR